MSFEVALVIVTPLDALLQDGNVAVGSDFVVLSFKLDKIHYRV
jgi:hypothetical protein